MTDDSQITSALADGELGALQMADAIARVNSDPKLRSRWLAYHVIGEVLREPAPSTLEDQRFLNAFSARLESEPIHLPLPQREPAPKRRPLSASGRFVGGAFAAAAAVAALTWTLVDQRSPAAAQPDVATQAAASVQAPPREIESYVIAHQQYAPVGRWQGGAAYVRATAWQPDAPGRNRPPSR